VLAAVEAKGSACGFCNYLVGALGRLVVLLRPAGLDVVAAGKGSRLMVRFDGLAPGGWP
jgi:hypothetical protein